MPICERCGKEFKSTYILNRHLSRKNPCKKTVTETTTVTFTEINTTTEIDNYWVIYDEDTILSVNIEEIINKYNLSVSSTNNLYIILRLKLFNYEYINDIIDKLPNLPLKTIKETYNFNDVRFLLFKSENQHFSIKI
jgi:hypothetical protein